MSKVKSIIIYILSVMLAFESGLLTIIVSVMMALHEEKKEPRETNSRVSYRSFYGGKSL